MIPSIFVQAQPIKIAACLLILKGLLNIISTIAYITTKTIATSESVSTLVYHLMQIGNITFGILYLLLAWFLIKGKRWAYITLLIIIIPTLAMNLLTLIAFGSTGGYDFIVSLLLFGLLISGRKDFFKNKKSSFGKADLLAIVIITNLIALITTAMFVGGFGFIKIERQIISFALSIILSYFLYQEKQWARWIFVILFSFAAYHGRGILQAILGSPINAYNAFIIFMIYFYFGSSFYLAFIREWPKKKKLHAKH